jgi:hypothetical protein
MTTSEIKSTTLPYLLFEQQVKSLCEPEMISILKVENERIKNPVWHLISRGGDALNYYYPEREFIPTHDWDLGLVSIPANNNVDQDLFNKLKEFIDSVGNNIATNLTNLFSTHIINQKFQDLVFTYNSISPRLSTIQFSYYTSGGQYRRSNSVADLYIWGNVQQGVTWTNPNGRLDKVDNVLHFDKKYDYTVMQQLKVGLANQTQLLQEALTQDLLNNRTTLFKNTFNYIIQDRTSDMKYVAPGDLLTDTMRMIYQSLYDINIANNKLDKYIVKYSRLLDVINKMSSLCSGPESCTEITADVISRNTNHLDCGGIKPIKNQRGWMEHMRGLLTEWYTIDYLNNEIWNLVPSKKLCEMVEVLRDVDEKKVLLDLTGDTIMVG